MVKSPLCNNHMASLLCTRRSACAFMDYLFYLSQDSSADVIAIDVETEIPEVKCLAQGHTNRND